jgi:uroporphyrinogen-III synthase
MKYIFSAANKRRNELPLVLTQYNIAVHELEVYTTTILEHITFKTYNGILFFSPSAVEGFFKAMQ